MGAFGRVVSARVPDSRAPPPVDGRRQAKTHTPRWGQRRLGQRQVCVLHVLDRGARFVCACCLPPASARTRGAMGARAVLSLAARARAASPADPDDPADVELENVSIRASVASNDRPRRLSRLPARGEQQTKTRACSFSFSRAVQRRDRAVNPSHTSPDAALAIAPDQFCAAQRPTRRAACVGTPSHRAATKAWPSTRRAGSRPT